MKKGDDTAFHATLDCPVNQICSHIAYPDDGTTAECNTATHLCEAVKPDDVACGGHVTNPHSCASSYTCYDPAGSTDLTGECLQNCGGIAGITCATGYVCNDNPTDSCDPTHGGADCPGLCFPSN